MKLSPPLKLIFSTLGSSLAWVGVFASALSIVSAIVRIARVGLSQIFSDVLETYRDFISPIYDFVALFIPEVTELSVDLLVIYFTLFTMSLRSTVFPLFNEEYFENELSNASTSQTLFFKEPPNEDLPAGAIFDFTTFDGNYFEVQHSPPKVFIWINRVLACLVLWPVVS